MASDEEDLAPAIGEIELGPAAEATVLAYRELAVDHSKRLTLALDTTCVNFLAYVIAEGAGSLVQGAVDTIELLSQSPECRGPLANTFGVLEALQEMADDARYSHELHNQCASIFTCLQYSRHVRSPEKAKYFLDSVDGAAQKHPAQAAREKKHRKFIDENSDVDKIRTNKNSKKVSPEHNFLGSTNSKARTVTLYIKNMINQTNRMQIEEELIKVRGLISIVFDLSNSRITCRIKKELSIDKLAAAVGRTEQYEAQQVISDQDGKEIIVKIAKSPSHVVTPVEELPDYLPEEDSPIRDSASAVASSGTLREAASTLLSAAANLLNKSFYW